MEFVFETLNPAGKVGVIDGVNDIVGVIDGVNDIVGVMVGVMVGVGVGGGEEVMERDGFQPAVGITPFILSFTLAISNIISSK